MRKIMDTLESLLVAIAPTGESRKIFNPANSTLVGLAPVHRVDDLEKAVVAAQKAQKGWAALGHAARSEVMLKVADAIDVHAEALAQLLSREQGKPLNGPNARFEVGRASAWLRVAASISLETEVLIEDENGRSEMTYRPIGVVGAISPWNWPMMIAMWQISPAIRMGNAVVAKPSEFTPLSVLALVAVMNTVLPVGLVTVVSGDREIGVRLSSHPAIGKVMFTGSTATGKAIIRSSADTVKRLTLELGGNDAGIVLPDVDPKAIAEGLFWGAFINSGQTCACLKRLYVHDSVFDEVVAELTAIACVMPMGEGTNENNVLGPLQNKQQFDIVARLVESARKGGGRVVLGGNPDASKPGFFYPTTLVVDVPNENPLVQEEQFGPALPIIRYSNIEDAIAMANGVDVGLGASVWSADRSKAMEVAVRIEAGTVWINSHGGGMNPMVPFGGTKQSGYGLEFGVEGLKALGVPQVISS
jgi:phenylacetaldehyde dehydrogenase